MKRKKKETPYLDFYEKCMAAGRMTGNGLCNSLLDEKELFYDFFELELPYEYDGTYWGYDGDTFLPHWRFSDDENIMYGFTPFRQTIVLFLAAMNNEL